jgi:hypothetical protein
MGYHSSGVLAQLEREELGGSSLARNQNLRIGRFLFILKFSRVKKKMVRKLTNDGN